jgi:hypothetical protein
MDSSALVKTRNMFSHTGKQIVSSYDGHRPCVEEVPSIPVQHVVQNDSSSEPTEDSTCTNFTLLICSKSNTVIVIMPSVQSADDYYLLHVTSQGMITLGQDQQSDYGHTFMK